MVVRKFIEIDEERCNGCGNCVTSCAEGALQIINGKAKVVKEEFCDGLGACIGECPQDALRIVEKDVAAFNEAAVREHLDSYEKNHGGQQCASGMCPGNKVRYQPNADKHEAMITTDAVSGSSELRQWPVQLHLVNPAAPYFRKANLLVGATCTAFSSGSFHRDLLRDRTLVIACPKLDRTDGYIEKLAAIFRENDIMSVAVARMEVPCCRGLSVMVLSAMELAGKTIPYAEVVIGIDGKTR